jgi:carbon-monoxide dehydrogenase medium subunit
MYLAAVRYTRPDTLAEAVDALASAPVARVLAGGQSLVNALKLRVTEVDLLVDVGRLEELRGVTVGADGALTIGAATTYREIERSVDVRGALPVLARVAGRLGDRQIRARGTVGGNVCFNDPLSNLPPLFAALGATFRIAGPNGSRVVTSEGFFLGPYETAVGDGEVLQSVTLPPLPPGGGVGYSTLESAEGSWALARCAALVAGEDAVTVARVALGCTALSPSRLPTVEAALLGRSRDGLDVAAVAATAGDECEFFGEAHAGAGYRHRMSTVVAERAIREALVVDG